jgi:hypothetical protein
MSKRQEKIEAAKFKQKEFLLDRKKMQLMMFEQAFEAGKHIYESNKEQIPANEIEQIEAQMKENQDIIDKLREEIGEINPQPEA